MAMSTKSVPSRGAKTPEPTKPPEEPPEDETPDEEPEPERSKAAAEGVYVVRETFHSPYGTYAKGQVVDGDDPALAGREHLFDGYSNRLRTR